MVQPNSQYGNSVYFPYAAGSLIAYAFSDERIRSEYTFKSFIYKKTDIDNVLESLEEPVVLNYSKYTQYISCPFKFDLSYNLVKT